MPKKSLRKVHAAVAVIERGGNILICRRHLHDSFGGLWEFPGGKREVGESWEACAQREVLEETGVRIHKLRMLGWMRQKFPDGVVIFKVFRCEAHGDPKPLDSKEIRWIRPWELPEYQFPPANKTLNARLAKG